MEQESDILGWSSGTLRYRTGHGNGLAQHASTHAHEHKKFHMSVVWCPSGRAYMLAWKHILIFSGHSFEHPHGATGQTAQRSQSIAV